MFKNRVRTAALAGAIAVATGVSGIVVVPANAQDTPQTGNHFNRPDGSKAEGGKEGQNTQPVKETKIAIELRKKANADSSAIKEHDLELFSPLERRPIEQDSYEFAKAKEEEATALLNRAVNTLNDIDATLKAVEAETKTAEAAWARYATAVSLTSKEKKQLTDLAAELNAPQAVQDAAAALPVMDAKPGEPNFVTFTQKTRAEMVAERDTILAFDEAVNEWIGTQGPGEEAVDNANKATQVYNLLWSFLGEWDQRDALYREALRLTQIATSRNIEVLRQAFDTAQANVRAARTIQAYYGVAARWLDLYENDTLRDNEENTIREVYRKVLFTNANNPEGVKRSLEQFAIEAHANADSNLGWENEVQRVRKIDDKYRNDAADKAAAEAREAAERASTKATLDSIAASLAALANSTEGQEPGAGAEKPGNGGSNPGNNTDVEGGKKLSPAAIAGIVLGVVVALGGIVAVAFPQIQHMLPKF